MGHWKTKGTVSLLIKPMLFPQGHLRKTQIPNDKFAFKILIGRTKNVSAGHRSLPGGDLRNSQEGDCLLPLTVAAKVYMCTYIHACVCTDTAGCGHCRGTGQTRPKEKPFEHYKMGYLNTGASGQALKKCKRQASTAGMSKKAERSFGEKMSH